MKPIWIVMIFLFVYGVFSIKVDAAQLSGEPAAPVVEGGAPAGR